MNHLHNLFQLNFETSTDSLPFHIQTIKRLENNERAEDNLRLRNNHFMIIWIVRGKGSYWVDLQKHEIGNNHILFIKPGQYHSLQLEQGFDGYIVSFTEAFLGIADHDSASKYNNFNQLFTNNQSITIDGEAVCDIKDITEIMLKEFNNHNLYRAEILGRYFKIFLIYLTRQFDQPLPPARQSRNTEIMQEFMQLLDKNFRTRKMVADYACQLGVTANYLNEVIKKLTGLSAGHHIRQRVALEAKRQAAYSNICMKKIAYDLGFYDMAHFSKFFKHTTGMSFSDFKQNTQLL